MHPSNKALVASLLAATVMEAAGLRVAPVRAPVQATPTSSSALNGVAVQLQATPTSSSALDGVAELYRHLSERHYLPLACVQSGCLRAGSDLFAQALREAPLDYSHAAAMGTTGILISGLIGAR